ncbi:ammonium permease MEP3 [Sugiyamaella lignohabitans]|uniref:Ammonium transporter n=1 Tax=Sugiyamaella lignohabitans TaxID=796027 RepID=A0A167DV92_9ASCO|nr:ammonium permease MEP3 [Sugiyamaella lignohabitans]ANB13333.1 ammonium permease MEP3 [Sugiyamaella lignohabitans]
MGKSIDVEDDEVVYNSTNILFMIFSTFAIFWMVQGAGLFYSGLTRRKSALIQAVYSLLALAIVSIQWFLLGYSLVFSESSGPFVGGFKRVGLRHALGDKGRSQVNIVPEVANALFGSMFPAVTAALTVGAVADRGRVLPAAIFIFIWTTLVYDPIAFWSWNKQGWARRMGSLDYAGGTIVHITSGFSALAYSLVLGKRLGHGTEQLNYRPHNTILVVIGTSLLWAGWFGFNAGSAFAPHTQSVIAMLNTQLSASAGGLAWAYMDYRLDSHWSIVGFCSGVVSGLVSITSGAGYIQPWAAIIVGCAGGCICNLSTKIKFFLDIDDALDVFAVHGVGGLMGTILTGVFATTSIDADIRSGGLIDGKILLLLHQTIVGSVTGIYAFFMSIIVLVLIKSAPNLHLRVRGDQELAGLDLTEHDEFVFDHEELISQIESTFLYANRNGLVGSTGYSVGDDSLPTAMPYHRAPLPASGIYKAANPPHLASDDDENDEEDPFNGTGMFPGISPRSQRTDYTPSAMNNNHQPHPTDGSPLLSHA